MVKRRRKGRGGRPRVRGVQRTPGGQLSRSKTARNGRDDMTEQEAKAVAVEARMRHTGLPLELAELNVAGMPNAGTVHGIMRLRAIEAERCKRRIEGGLSAEEWRASDWWLGVRTAYLRAIDAPGRAIEPKPLPEDRPDVDPTVDPEQAAADWAVVLRELWGDVLECLQEASTSARRPLIAALDLVLVRGADLEHLHGDLRLGLNAIHRKFLEARRR